LSISDVNARFEATFVSGLPALASASTDDIDLLGKLKSTLLATLEELDQLPREHPVWALMANQKVNQYRLAKLVKLRLRSDPLDCGARWVRIAIGLVNGANEFPKEDWTALLQGSPRFDSQWLIFEALRRSIDWGDITAAHAADFLQANDLWQNATAVLKALVDGRHDSAATAWRLLTTAIAWFDGPRRSWLTPRIPLDSPRILCVLQWSHGLRIPSSHLR